MTSCYIIGGGKKNKIPNNCFTIGCNMHYPDSNILVAIDEPIIQSILKDNLTGFSYQPLVTNNKIGEYYKDYTRCIMFKYQDYYNVNSISSGLLAITFANFLSFSCINLLGFDKLMDEHRDKFLAIKQPNRDYIIYDSKNNYTVC